MRTFLIQLFISFAIGAAACSGTQKSFCLVKADRPGHFVICGVITASASHSIEMKVIDVLSGLETRSIITIWDGTDFDCTGNVSMKASDMGFVGDTLIAILPKISDTPENTWDVIGDYRRPFSLFQTAWLNVVKDSVRGYIAGPPNINALMKYSYAGFKSYWQNHSNDCITLSVRETVVEKLNVRVLDGRISIHSLSEEHFLLRLYSIDGRLLKEWKPERQEEADCSYFP
jgi:hypothetical protein